MWVHDDVFAGLILLALTVGLLVGGLYGHRRAKEETLRDVGDGLNEYGVGLRLWAEAGDLCNGAKRAVAEIAEEILIGAHAAWDEAGEEKDRDD